LVKPVDRRRRLAGWFGFPRRDACDLVVLIQRDRSVLVDVESIERFGIGQFVPCDLAILVAVEAVEGSGRLREDRQRCRENNRQDGEA